MKKMKLTTFEIMSVFSIFILGVLLHFTYDWSSENSFVALFSAINESTWEHLKLIFFPTLFFTFIGCLFYQKEIPNFLCAKTKGILISLSFLVLFFYTFKGIMGFSLAFLNISSFFISVLVGEYFFFKEVYQVSCCNKMCLFFLVFLMLLFFLFTFYPPHIPLFQDPVTLKYGK